MFLYISDKIEVGRTCTVATDTPNCHDSSTCEGVGDATEGKCTPRKYRTF